MTLALAIAGLVLSGTLTLVSTVQKSSNNRILAADMLSIGKAVQHYITVNRVELLAAPSLGAIGAVDEIRVRDADSGDVTLESLVGSGALQGSFPVSNLIGNNYRVLIRRLDDSVVGVGNTDMLVGMIYTYNGSALKSKDGAVVAGQIGAAGGFVYADDTATFNGTLGYWQEPVADWAGTWAAPTAGSIVLSTSMLSIVLPTTEAAGAKVIDDLSDGMTFYTPNKSMYLAQDAANISSSGSNNTVVGQGSLKNASGSDTTVIGNFSLTSVGNATNKGTFSGYQVALNGGGTSNVGIGFQSLFNSVSSAARNIAIGDYTLAYASTAATDNVAIGRSTLAANSSAAGANVNRNTVIGHSALQYSLAANDNTVVGILAMSQLKNADENTVVGYNTLTSINPSSGAITGNVVLGNNILTAGTTNLTFNYNVIVSDLSACTLSSPTASVQYTTILGKCSTLSSEAEQTYFGSHKILTSGNTQIGFSITSSNAVTIGSQARTADVLSVAVGYSASFGAASQSRSVSIGNNAGASATNQYTVSVGYLAGSNSSTTSGGYNVSFGHFAGAEFVGASTATKNTSIGYMAGYGSLSTQNNILIGNISGISSGTNNIVFHQEPTFAALALSNPSNLLQLTTAIRGNISSRYVVMGGAGTEAVGGTLSSMSLYVPDGGILATGYYYTSDRMMKKDIESFDLSESSLKTLRPVSFSMKKDSVKKLGFIAQNVQKIFPAAVVSQGPYLGLDYGVMTVPLVSILKKNEEEIVQKTSHQDNSTMQINSLLNDLKREQE